MNMVDGGVENATTLKTTRFGEIEIKEEDVFTFSEGLLGFESFKRFVLLDNPTGGPLKWLQSATDGALAFIVANPTLFIPDYKVELHQSDLDQLEMASLEEGTVMTIMRVPAKNPRAMTANLQGPLLLNKAKKLAKQIVLSHGEYSIEHRVFQD